MANEEKVVEVSNRESEWRDHYFLFLDLELYGAMDANCDRLIRDWICIKIIYISLALWSCTSTSTIVKLIHKIVKDKLLNSIISGG